VTQDQVSTDVAVGINAATNKLRREENVSSILLRVTRSDTELLSRKFVVRLPVRANISLLRSNMSCANSRLSLLGEQLLPLSKACIDIQLAIFSLQIHEQLKSV
jgi:hypothetical protein